MTLQFDAETFRNTLDIHVGRYLDTLPLGDASKPTVTELARLLEQIDTMSDVHATYVVMWAVETDLPHIADTIVRLLRRCQDRGGQYTLTRALAAAKDLAQRHIDDIEVIHSASPHFILAGGLSELREAWSKRRTLAGEPG